MLYLSLVQAGRGRGVVARGRAGGPPARGGVANRAARGGVAGGRGVARQPARGGARAKGSLPGEITTYFFLISPNPLFSFFSCFVSCCLVFFEVTVCGVSLFLIQQYVILSLPSFLPCSK